MQMHDSMQGDKASTASSQNLALQSCTAANQPLAQQQQQGLGQGLGQLQGQAQTPGQGQGQGQVQPQGQGQSAGQRSEAELAAVEHGLSALEQQITSAALRYVSGAKPGT